VKISLEHDALLKACTASDTEFVANLLEWERIQDIETIDFASMRLIPYLYRKAESLKVQMANKGICKGLYLKAWYLHNTIKTPTIEWIEQQELLENAILLKGGALQYTIYKKDPPSRPSDDVDLLLPRHSAEKALDLLEKQNFQVNHKLSKATIFNLRNGINYFSLDKSIDIHWGIFPVCSDLMFTSRAFDRTIQVSEKLKILSPTDNLIHCLIHGYGTNDLAPIRWVLDAHLLVTSGMVDWELFWEEIDRTGWHRIIRQQIEVLSRYNTSIDIPRFINFHINAVMFVTEMMLKTNNVYLRRALRLLGYDFGVWAQNFGVKPTLVNYFKTMPKWLPLIVQEWREFITT
jgi:hypothetical protein